MTTTDPAVEIWTTTPTPPTPTGPRHQGTYNQVIDICRKNGTQTVPRHRAQVMDRGTAIGLLEDYVGDEHLTENGPRRSLTAARLIAGNDQRALAQLDAAACALGVQP